MALYILSLQQRIWIVIDTLNRIPELLYFVLWCNESIFRSNDDVNRLLCLLRYRKP